MSDIGGRELGAGIAAAGRSLGDGIAKYRERRKLDKEDDAAFGAVGTAVEHMVKQGSLPEGVLTKYMDISQGGIEQKRGFLRGLGTVLQYVDRATERKAQAERAAADDVRADRYLKLQEGVADERGARIAAEGRFRGDLARYAQPTTTTVGAGSFAVPVPVQPRLSPEFVMGLAARHNVDPPANLRHFISEPPQPAWEPQSFDVDGTKMVTTSRNSAMPVPSKAEPKAKTVRVRMVDPEDPDTSYTYEMPMEEFQAMKGAPAKGTGGKKQLDRATAAQFLKQAGGDANKARQLARDAGFEF